MATVSMLLLILGAGGILLGLSWCLQAGLHLPNMKPAIAGTILLAAGLMLPVTDSGSSAALQSAAPKASETTAQPLNLSIQPTITTRLQSACSTNPQGRSTCWGESVPLPEGSVHKVALGRAHGCALMQTGTVACWGAVQLEASHRSGSRFVDIASTLETICGITAQGALHCTGADLGMPPPGRRWTRLSGGAHHMCALTADGSPACWGDNSEGQANAPEDLQLRAISAGHFHTCAIDATGSATCWGRNTESQSQPPALSGLTQISAGWAHTCAIDDSGQATCWGCSGRHAGLMTGGTEACEPPSTPMSAISAGDLWQSCGLTMEGEPTCWGGLARDGGPA